MKFLSELLTTFGRRLIGRTRRSDLALELQQELDFHQDLLERDNLQRGLSPDEARNKARIQVGNRARIAEDLWNQLSFMQLDTLLRDVKFAIRTTRRSVGYATTVILTLALGIGATATVFSVVDHVLLRPLSYANAVNLVVLYEHGDGGSQRVPSYPTLQDWSRSNAGFADVAYIRGNTSTLSGLAIPERVLSAFVSEGYFRILGTRPVLGRTFSAEEESPGGPATVILSNRIWKREFGSDPQIIGRVVTLDSSRTVVIGVMPASFQYPDYAQVWRPLGQIIDRDPVLRRRDFHADSKVIGRLAAGIDIERARRLLTVVQLRLAANYPGVEGKWTGVDVVPLRTEVVGDVGPALWTLSTAVFLILLIACVNVANLSAVRGASRGREIAVRFALGASRVDVTRQLAIESLLQASIGGCLGILGCYIALKWLRATAPFELPRVDEISLDWRVLAVALALVAVTAVLFGVLPALRAAAPRGAVSELIGGRSAPGGTRRETRGRALLTGSQFALALMLLIAAGLLIQSYRRLEGARLGFDPRNVYALTMFPSESIAADPSATLALYQRLIERLKAVPGVEAAAFVNFLPPGRAGVQTQLQIPGRTVGTQDLATYVTVSDGYLTTMHVRLVRGRWFSPEEMHGSGNGIVISEAVAKRYWPGIDPIGRPLTIFRSSQDRQGFGSAVPVVVLGTVDDVRQYGPDTDLDAAVYVPMSSEVWPWGSLVVRERSPGLVSAHELANIVRTNEPSVAISGSGEAELKFQSLSERLSAALAPRRYLLTLVGAFSVCALVLAAVGIYGVTNYSVSRRARELGVRIALGATSRDIIGSVLKRSMIPALAGCVFGALGAFALVRVLEHLLYNTSITDPAVMMGIPVLLIAVGLTASYVPARRAARTSPLASLRTD